jgi:hypothetical protein
MTVSVSSAATPVTLIVMPSWVTGLDVKAVLCARWTAASPPPKDDVPAAVTAAAMASARIGWLYQR